MVDTDGRLWAAHVHAANDADGPASLVLVSAILWYGGWVEKVFGDGSYGGVFAKELARWGIDFERASRPESAQGFCLLPNVGSLNEQLPGQTFFGESSKIMSTRYLLR